MIHVNTNILAQFSSQLHVYIYVQSGPCIPIKTCQKDCVPGRVLARISKMPVQNSNFKMFARPDLASYLLQILLPATLNSLVCQKGQFTLQLCPRRWFVRKISNYYIPKFLGNYLSKRQVGQVLAKSLDFQDLTPALSTIHCT